MTIVHVASEVAPFSKTGGLADVAGSLPPALVAAGADVNVVSPCYPSVRRPGFELATAARFDVAVAGARWPVTLLETRHEGVRHLFVDCPELYDRPGIYGDENGDYPDNAERFLLLCRAAVAGLKELDIVPAVIHCHDWQTGLLLLIVAAESPRPATVFTIHNLGYQGLFPADTLTRLGVADRPLPDLDHFGRVSFLKAGLVHGDRLTTVSPTYAREIQEPELGFGMDGVLRARRAVLAGLLNGLDTGYW
ncbi:MAG TPA: glycogen synthase, partial [candidate division WOR-3 bacterium]|nr:glycogen synthase [candidate division WOR-3 bacterium]